MVDWDRVDQLRSKGWDWDDIADDPKVGFQAQKGTDPGRALRVLYHRRRGRGTKEDAASKSPKKATEERERRWTLLRVGFLIVPVLGIWALLAYVIPSPVGLILPAVPWLLLVFAVIAFVFGYALLRANRRWSPVFRNTLIGGIVLGLVFTGVVALTGDLVFGCPFLSSSTAAKGGPGWTYASVSPWQDGGKPVLYFYGATWCPYCSAGSWAIWKALTEFGTVSGAQLQFSSPNDVDPTTPEIDLSSASVVSSNISFQVSEDTSMVDGTFPPTSNCFQAAYFGAYGQNSIPFVVINGQYVHGGTYIINPTTLSTWTEQSYGSGGAGAVQGQVQSENGTAWNAIAPQAYWMMAYLARSTGAPLDYLASHYHWSSSTKAGVQADYAAL